MPPLSLLWLEGGEEGTVAAATVIWLAMGGVTPTKLFALITSATFAASAEAVTAVVTELAVGAVTPLEDSTEEVNATDKPRRAADEVTVHPILKPTEPLAVLVSPRALA